MIYFYLDKDNNVIPCEEGMEAFLEWSTWFDNTYMDGSHWIASTKIKGILVSTIFLGMNHQWGEGPPVVFETMILGGWIDQEYQERYCTYDEAKEGHAAAIKVALKYTAWHYRLGAPFKKLWNNRHYKMRKIKDRWKTKAIKSKLLENLKALLK